MRKFRLIVAIFAVTIGMAIVFNACQKKEVLDNTKQEQAEIPTLKYLRADYAIINGVEYKLDTQEAWSLFERYGGQFWYYDSRGIRHWYWPNGDPYWRPRCCGYYSPPPPPPSTPIGRFVLHTLVDIMNAPLEQRRAIVTENMNAPYSPCSSLSDKIDNTILKKVVSGEYIIHNIRENITGNEELFRFNYIIHFLNQRNGTAEDVQVSFVFERIRE